MEIIYTRTVSSSVISRNIETNKKLELFLLHYNSSLWNLVSRYKRKETDVYEYSSVENICTQ
jgi:hypothetical protein